MACVDELDALHFRTQHGAALVRRRIRGAAIDLAPWLLEVEIGGQQRYGFFRTEEAGAGAALEILGRLAEAAHAEDVAVAALVAAGAVVEADAFA